MSEKNSNTLFTDSILNVVNQQLHKFFDTKTQIFRNNAEKIDKVYSLFDDKASARVFAQQLGFLISGIVTPWMGDYFNPMSHQQWRAILESSAEELKKNNAPQLKGISQDTIRSDQNMLIGSFIMNSYRYEDKVKVEPGDVFLDCGAYIGDTAIWAYRNGAAQVYSFEPCRNVLDTLKFNLQAYSYPIENIFPFAFSRKTEKSLMFVDNTHPAGAQLVSQDQVNKFENKQGLTEIESVSIDDWCTEHNVKPTFIKMDIEGAEPDALEGGAETIKRLKPKLAICLYHRLTDAWEIPLYIHSLVPEYRFYCRKVHPSYDFILYATV